MLFVDTEHHAMQYDMPKKPPDNPLSVSCQYHSHSGQYRSSNSAQCRTGDNGHRTSGCGPATRKHSTAASRRLAPVSFKTMCAYATSTGSAVESSEPASCCILCIAREQSGAGSTTTTKLFLFFPEKNCFVLVVLSR